MSRLLPYKQGVNLAATVLAAVIGVMVGGQQAAASLMLIDDFTDSSVFPDTFFHDGSVASAVNADGSLDPATALGGQRTLHYTRDTAPANPGLENVEYGVFQSHPAPGEEGVPTFDLLAYKASGGLDGQLTVSYGDGSAVLADLSTAGHFEIDLYHYALGAGPLVITVTLNDGTNSASVTRTIAAAGQTQAVLELADLIGSVDRSAVRTLSVTFDTAAGGEVYVDQIRSVPEPGSAALLGVGVGMLLLRRRTDG